MDLLNWGGWLGSYGVFGPVESHHVGLLVWMGMGEGPNLVT